VTLKIRKLGCQFLLVALCTLFFVASCNDKSNKVCDADFDTAMGKNSPEWNNLCSRKGNTERLNKLKGIYDAKKPSKIAPASSAKIPKIIHQIWLGPKPPPGYFWDYRQSWQKNHPDWEYRFWTDKEAEELDFELKDLYLRSTNWGEKSDILRAEILDRFGGLYVDTDFECIKPFDELHLKYDFYTGLEPPHEGDFTSSAPHVTISDALIGTVPHHPIICEWKRLMRRSFDELEQKYPDSPKRVLLRTFYPFGDAVNRKIVDGNLTNIVFPATYFYPLTFTEISKGRLKKLSFLKRQIRSVMSAFNLRKPVPFVEIQPETMAIHFWGNSWIKSHEERFREMYRQIIKLQGDLKHEVKTLQNQINGLNEKLEKETAVKT